MGDVLESEVIESPVTKDIYVLLVRFNGSNWSSKMTFDDLKSASKFVSNPIGGVSAWRLVKVTGLPIQAAKGEV